jgi:hypothetical protein
VDVDPVEQRAGDALHPKGTRARDDRRRAAAVLLGISAVAAWAEVFVKRTLYAIVSRQHLLDMESYRLFLCVEDQEGIAQTTCPVSRIGHSVGGKFAPLGERREVSSQGAARSAPRARSHISAATAW